MNEKDWLLLVTLDQERNITKAAEKLYISQPALSYRIKKIEEYFNASLFVRERTGIRLTHIGDVVIKYAKEMLAKLTTLHDTIQLMDKDVKGTIKIGVASTFGQYILPELLRQFLELYPEVNVDIVTGLSTDIYKKLENGDIHLAIIRGEQKWEEERLLLTTEPICLVAKQQITIDDLQNIPRIKYETDPYLMDLINNWLKDRCIKEKSTSMSVDSLETGKELVRTGIGYTILPGICLLEETNLFIRPLHLSNGEKTLRRTWAYCRKDVLDFATVNAFFLFLSEYKIKLPNFVFSFENK